MTESDKIAFIEIMEDLAEILEATLTERKMILYYRALDCFSLEEIQSAANHIARNATFFPKPVEFKTHILGDIDTRATEAWLKALKNKNSYQTVIFDSPVIHGTIQAMGGWIKFCQMEGYKEEKWQMTDFLKIYKSLVGSKGEWPSQLTGQAELDNASKGLMEFIPPPKLIGDVSKIKLEHKKDKTPIKVQNLIKDI